MKRGILAVFLVASVLVAIFTSSTAFAQQAQSTNYSVDQAFFGIGGQLCDPGVSGYSTNYCATSAAGEMTVGNTSSTNYQAQTGHNVDRDPYLELIVTASNADLGVLSTSSAATTTGAFSVKSYLSSGYVVTNASNPPANTATSPHTFTNLTSPTASSVGTEQFGINLVANTSPSTFGAAPVQVPSGSFSFGAAASGYNTANQYKYVKGDTIASSSQSSGETDYTVSYLFNISNVTPAGRYTFTHIIVATATF